MNANAKKWVEALRSGKYEQGKKRLNKDGKFCCLGVACDLALASGVSIRVELDGYGLTTYDGWGGVLPKTVVQWLELRDGSGSLKGTFKGERTLATENDSGKTFAEIADIIESEPAGLFV